ncbi:MAG: Serine hydroxymethyltransferase (EC [uncultured Caballeronia sp.]|nr:MAG: Serine hydroxymethyltransferase (EC [uncultured Caballeronia sp.]
MRVASHTPGTCVLFDGSHPAGLIAARLNNNPFAAGVHFVTTTTNKTLCGARGAFVACLPEWAETMARAVFPGLTAGPHGHEMYAKLVGYVTAQSSAFRELMSRVQDNARQMATDLAKTHGVRLVVGGTDTHMVLVDLRSASDRAPSGLQVEIWAERCGIYVNRNTIPFDPRPDQNATSRLRIGLGSVSQRGMRRSEIRELAGVIASIVRCGGNGNVCSQIRRRVSEIASAFPMPGFYR